MIRFIPNIKVIRKVWNEQGLLRIELGKWWEIVITRELAESLTGYSKLAPSKAFTDGRLIKLLKDGEILPFWYGYAYYDFNRDCAAYCPVPINFLVAAARWLRQKWYEFKGLSRKFNSTQDAYERGRKSGYKEGYNEGAKLDRYKIPTKS